MRRLSPLRLGFDSGIARSLAFVLEEGDEKNIGPYTVKIVKKTAANSIASDWKKLGGDMRRALKYVAANTK